MTNRPILMAAAIGLSSIAQADAVESVSIQVPIGKPTLVHHLKYQVMYSEKPFELASIHYYDNGIYKIVSPGEAHYGVYLVVGDIDEPTYRISYLSLPHEDWGGNVAKHELTFDNRRQVFEQQALSHADQAIAPQHGTFTRERNTTANPADISWE